MKKILLILTVCFFVGCTNATPKDREYVKNYIKDIDAKIEAEINTNPREKYKKPLSAEEVRTVPLMYKQYVEEIKENGYLNIYNAYDHSLIQSFTLGENGKPYGVYKVFYKDGKLKEIGFIDEGKASSGTTRVFYPSGKLHKLIPYYKGSVEGDRIFYYENGQIQEIYRYVNSKEVGEGRINHENGNPVVIETFENGKKEGPYSLYDENGKLMEKGVNKNGKPIPDKEFSNR